MPTSGQNRPFVVVRAKELIRFLVQEHEVILLGPHTAQNAEYHLNEERRLDQALIDEPFDVVEVAQIIAFKLELRAVVAAQFLNRIADGAEGVREDEVLGHLQKRAFPVVLKLGVLLKHREDAEIH